MWSCYQYFYSLKHQIRLFMLRIFHIILLWSNLVYLYYIMALKKKKNLWGIIHFLIQLWRSQKIIQSGCRWGNEERGRGLTTADVIFSVNFDPVSRANNALQKKSTFIMLAARMCWASSILPVTNVDMLWPTDQHMGRVRTSQDEPDPGPDKDGLCHPTRLEWRDG